MDGNDSAVEAEWKATTSNVDDLTAKCASIEIHSGVPNLQRRLKIGCPRDRPWGRAAGHQESKARQPDRPFPVSSHQAGVLANRTDLTWRGALSNLLSPFILRAR